MISDYIGTMHVERSLFANKKPFSVHKKKIVDLHVPSRWSFWALMESIDLLYQV